MSTKYRTIVADPPWPYSGEGAPGASSPKVNGEMDQSAALPYGTLTIDEISALSPAAEDDAHLYLWTTNAFMGDAYTVARAWGFEPKTILTWVKVHQDNPAKVSMKVGYYFRGASEHVLFAVRGSLRTDQEEARPTAYLWPRLGHSEKPDAFYDLVEQASPGPYLELFARRARFGWDYWGDQSLGTAEVAA